MGLYNRAQMERDIAAAEAFDQEVSRRVAEGTLSGFIAMAMAKEVEKTIARCRMKLVNAGRIIADLQAAKSEAASVETPGLFDHADVKRGQIVNREQLGFSERGDRRVKAAFESIRYNSDGRKSPPEPLREPLPASQSHEIRLDDPEAQAELEAAKIAGKRVFWRPGGREVARIYEE